jgi:hypothetical protein
MPVIPALRSGGMWVQGQSGTWSKTLYEWKKKNKTEKQKIVTYYYISIRIPQIQNTDNTEFWWRCEVLGILIYWWCERKMTQALWKRIWQFLTKHTYSYHMTQQKNLLKGIEHLCLYKYVYMDIYSSFIYIWQNLDALQ